VAFAEGVGFTGTSRFEILTRLGMGGAGVVYSALDREQNVRVALKTLRTMNARALVRFKNEFRSLQDLQHPNLINLGELFEENGEWFFTMELIQGVNFLEYVCPRGPSPLDRSSSEGASPSLSDVDPAALFSRPPAAPSPPPRGPHAFDEVRLRDGLRQLAQGLFALHNVGKVHRDIKPSNVLCTHTGRLILLDFGLVTDLWDGDLAPELHAVGTTSYMAPEQAAAEGVGVASDWYSVGVVLYQALTGRLPFSGTVADVLRKKNLVEPTPPRTFSHEIPDDLDALCVDLLRRSPAARPSERELRRRLALPDPREPSLGSLAQGAPFVGRQRELELVRQAYGESRRGAAVTLLLHGESGIGKSTLCKHFAQAAAREDDTLVLLAGRCYERESVPYKALDGVVDALGRFLKVLPRIDAVTLLPARADLLSQVFPTLRQVEAIAELPPYSGAHADRLELRGKVFAALRELFERLTERRPLLVVIDDLQWADADSLALLAELIRTPWAPPFLLLCTVRVAPDAPLREDLLEALQGDVRSLYLPGMPLDEATLLCTLLSERLVGPGHVVAEQIAAEANGHPLFIEELTRHAVLTSEPAPHSLQLDQALWARIQALDPDARFLLQLLVMAGKPLPRRLCAEAARVDWSDLDKHIAALRVGHLIRTSGTRPTDPVEPLHERVRKTVLSHLDPETRRLCHERLAIVWEAEEHTDPEALAQSFLGAGQRARAATFAEHAAIKAERALAFDRAARLYAWALELADENSDARHRLEVRLADALTSAGRCAEAAATYQRAAESADHSMALMLRRRAVEEFLGGGHVDEALAALEGVLGSVGIALPRTPRAALLSLLWHRTQLWFRGLGFEARDESQVPPGDLARVDTLWLVGTELGAVDFIQGAAFQTQNLLYALEAGEPYRVIRGLCSEAAFSAVQGGRGVRRSAELLGAVEKLLPKTDQPYALALVTGVPALVHVMSGRWKQAISQAERALTLFRERCTGVTFDIDSLELYSVIALASLGELGELARRVSQCLHVAKARGDLLARTLFRTGLCCYAWLGKDDPSGARREATQASAEWSQRGTVVQAYLDLQAQVEIDLYEGQPQSACERLTLRWPALKRSYLLRVQYIQIQMSYLAGRAALAAAATQDKDKRRLLRQVDRAVRRIEREDMPWGDALALLLCAGACRLRGDTSMAITTLALAASALDAVDMGLHAAVARRRQAELIGGELAEGLVRSANAWMSSHGVKNPTRMTAQLAPGL
jgi:hypothetical protein